MIAGPDGRSNGTESEKPTTAATTALSTAIEKIPRMLRASSNPVTAGSTRKLNTRITPANCIANAITRPSVKYRNRFQKVTR